MTGETGGVVGVVARGGAVASILPPRVSPSSSSPVIVLTLDSYFYVNCEMNTRQK